MLGVGVDLVNLQEMQETLQRSGDLFLTRVYCAEEIAQGQSCELPIHFFAGAFAIKEAVFKALKLSWQSGVDFREIKVNRGEAGEPVVVLKGKVGEIAAKKKMACMDVSISYEKSMAIGFVVAQFD